MISLRQIFQFLNNNNISYKDITNPSLNTDNFFISAPEIFAQKTQPQQILFLDVQDNRLQEYIATATQRRVACIVIPQAAQASFDKPLENTSLIFVESVKKICSALCQLFIHSPPKHVCAVTGSSGKSSSAFFGYKIALSQGIPAAFLGTEGLITANQQSTVGPADISAPRTTPSPPDMVRIFNLLAKKNIDMLFTEASAHGIHQNRTDLLKCTSTAFTYLGDAHINEFDSIEKIKDIKWSFLQSQNVPFAVHESLAHDINTYNLSHLPHIVFGSSSKAQLQLTDWNPQTQLASIRYNNETWSFSTQLFGNTQIMNVLCGVSMLALSLNAQDRMRTFFKEASNLGTFSGRMEKISTPKDPVHAIVDFAHHPSAIRHTLEEIKKIWPHAKIHSIIGGSPPPAQDEQYYKATALILSELSHKTYITTDNPRWADPKSIAKSFLKHSSNGVYIPDRKEALAQALNNADPGDCIVALGKGDESTITIKDQVIPHNDRTHLKHLLQKGLACGTSKP